MSEINPWAQVIATDRIRELYEFGIKTFSEKPVTYGQPHVDCVEGKAGNAWMAEQYTDRGPGAIPALCFAGYLIYYVVKGHCFPDGNKRLGFALVVEILGRHGLTIAASQEEAAEFTESIASGAVRNGAEATNWIANRVAPAD